MDFRCGHRVTNVFRKRSQGHGKISAVTNCDPSRGRMHCAYGSDHPLHHGMHAVLHSFCVVGRNRLFAPPGEQLKIVGYARLAVV